MGVDKLLRVIPLKTDCDVTKLVKIDWNTLTDQEFINKYFCTKQTYLVRVLKFGDPYVKRGLLFNIFKKIEK